MAGQVTWTDELIKTLEERQELFSVARERNTIEYAISGDEFPTVASPVPRRRIASVTAAVRRALGIGRARDDY